MPLSPFEFSRRIKDKYPEYRDIDDIELSRRVVEKYPDYKTEVDFSLTELKPESEPSKKLPSTGAYRGGVPRNAPAISPKGIAKEIGEIATLPERGMRGAFVGAATRDIERAAEAVKPGFVPRGTDEEIAAGAGEFIGGLPAFTLAAGVFRPVAAAAASPFVSKIARSAIRGGIDVAGGSAIMQTLHDMSIKGEVDPNDVAVATGVGAVTGLAFGAAIPPSVAALKAIKRVSEPYMRRIQAELAGLQYRAGKAFGIKQETGLVPFDIKKAVQEGRMSVADAARASREVFESELAKRRNIAEPIARVVAQNPNVDPMDLVRIQVETGTPEAIARENVQASFEALGVNASILKHYLSLQPRVEAGKVTPKQPLEPKLPENLDLKPSIEAETKPPVTQIEPQKAEVAPPPVSKQPDAVFVGFMEDPDTGSKIPFFNVTKPGHPRLNSTVSRETLEAEGLNIPEVPGQKPIELRIPASEKTSEIPGKPPKPPEPPSGLSPEQEPEPQQPKIIDQTFKTKKFNLQPEQENELKSLLGAVGLGQRKVETFEDWTNAAADLGAEPEKLLKELETKRASKIEIKALTDLISNNMDFVAKAEQEITANPAIETELRPKIAAVFDQTVDAMKKQIKSGTEAGRAIAAFRIMARKTLDPAIWIRQAQKQLGERVFTPDMLAAINDLIKKSDVNGLAEFVAGLRIPTMAEKVITLWKAGLLTSPTTHMANIFGNSTMATLLSASDVAAIPLDVMLSLVTGKRTITFSPANVSAKIKAMPNAAKQAKKYIQGEIYDLDLKEKWDLPRKVTFNNKILNFYTDAVFKSLGAEDIFFRQLTLEDSFLKQAEVIATNEKLKVGEYKARVKNLLLNPSNEMVLNAIDAAEYSTFQNPNLLADAIIAGKRSLGRSDDAVSQAAKVASEVVLPFVKTPANVGARILDFSPVGFIKAALMQANPKTRGQKQFVEDVSRAMTGSSFMAFGAFLAALGLANGAAPTKEKERVDFYADGRIPYSMYFNGHWLGLNRISPAGNLIALGAELYNLSEEKEGFDLAVSGFFAGVKNLKEQTMLMGLSQAMKASEYPTSAEKYINRTISSLVPSVIGKLARTVDPTLRKPDGIAESVAARIPFLTFGVPPRRDVFGTPAQAPGGHLTLFDPFSTVKAKNDPILREAKKVGVSIGLPNDTFFGVKLNNREYDVYHQVYGGILKQSLTILINHPRYESAHEKEKSKQFEILIKEAKERIDEEILPGILIHKFSLPLDTKPNVAIGIISILNREDDKFKRLPDSKKEAVIKQRLNEIKK